MAAPDFKKLAEISTRMEAASELPGFGEEQFDSFEKEVREACGDHPEYTEILFPYDPSEVKARREGAAAQAHREAAAFAHK